MTSRNAISPRPEQVGVLTMVLRTSMALLATVGYDDDTLERVREAVAHSAGYCTTPAETARFQALVRAAAVRAGIAESDVAILPLRH